MLIVVWYRIRVSVIKQRNPTIYWVPPPRAYKIVFLLSKAFFFVRKRWSVRHTSVRGFFSSLFCSQELAQWRSLWHQLRDTICQMSDSSNVRLPLSRGFRINRMWSRKNSILKRHVFINYFLKGVLYCFRDKLPFKRNQSIARRLCINRLHLTPRGRTEFLLHSPLRVTVEHQRKLSIHSGKKCPALCLHFMAVQVHGCGVVPQGHQTRDS